MRLIVVKFFLSSLFHGYDLCFYGKRSAFRNEYHLDNFCQDRNWHTKEPLLLETVSAKQRYKL
jgi:hypothetical protein